MSARRLFTIALTVGLLTLAVAVSADPSDAIDFRRVALRADQLATEMERVRLGVLRQMPRDQFDELARRALAPSVQRPRLLETRYSARLVGETLVGSAVWTIRHTETEPALLTVDPLHIAVRRVAWSENRAAVLGDLAARPQTTELELLVDGMGDRKLNLDWSARGIPEPAGVRFDLRLPSCPLAMLDIELPDNLEPFAARQDVMLSGPLQAPPGAIQTWRVAFGPLSQLDLSIRPRVPAADAAPIVLVRQRNRQELLPGLVQCEYAVEFDAARAPVRQLTFECDRGLRLTEVTGRNIRGWDVVGPSSESGRVTVELAEPTQGGVVTLRGTTAQPGNGVWVCPAVRVPGALSHGEMLTLRVHPDMSLGEWRAGGFRVADSSVGDDRWHTIVLQPAVAKPDPVRPSARIKANGPEYTVRERIWWLVAADRTSLTAELTCTVKRGSVDRVPVSLPAGWAVDRVAFGRSDVDAEWEVEQDRSVLTLIWPRPLGAGDAASATLYLVRQRQRPTSSEPLVVPFPDVVPIGASGRDGVLAVRVEPELDSSVRGSASLAIDPTADWVRDAPWSGAMPTSAYPLMRSPAEGFVRFASLRPRYNTTATTRVTVLGRRASLIHNLRIDPTGAPDAILLHVPAAGIEPWNWQVVRGSNRVRATTRLAAGPSDLKWFAVSSSWQAVALTGVSDPASWWRVSFDRPLSEPVELRATLDLTLPTVPSGRVAAALAPLGTVGGLPCVAASVGALDSPNRWVLPLVRTPDARREEHTVELAMRSPGWAVGTTDVTEHATADGSPAKRTFRCDGPGARIDLSRSLAMGGLIDGGRVASSVRVNGGCDHELTLQAWDWHDAQVTVGLPLGAIVRWARVNGVEVRSDFDNRARLRVSIPFGSRLAKIEVRFSTGGRPWTLWSRHEPPAIDLGDGSSAVESSLHCPDDVVPLLGEADGAAVTLVRPKAWSLAGFAVAVACYLVVRGVSRRWPLAVGLGLASIAVVLLPDPVRDVARWPFYALVVATLASVLPRRALAGVPAAAVALAVCLTVPGQASAPAVATVYLVPGSTDVREARTVLVPAEFLDRLTARARSNSLPEFVAPIEAQYIGRIVGGTAQIKATLTVEVNSDGPHTLSLPIGGALLRDATLDGAAAFPRAVGDRIGLVVVGRGRHRIELDFAVPCPVGDDRELKFPVPETPVCSLSLRLPNAARFVQTIARRGDQRLTDEDGVRRLEVDCGRVSSINVRWRQEGPNAAPPTMAVHEAYLWDLRPSSAKLTAALRYTIGGGVATLAIDVPSPLEVTAVSARQVDAQGTAGSVASLRSWRVAPMDGGRRLSLEFSAPVAGNWLVTVEAIPAEPFATSFTLPVPSTVGTTAASPVVVAWRAEGFTPRVARIQGWTDMPADVFLQEHWLPARIEADPRPPTRAYRRTLASMPALLRLAVRAEELPRADVAAVWHVGPRRAALSWTARVASVGGKISLIECDVPPAVGVQEVTGFEVLRWSRAGTRVQIWLRKSVASADVGLLGVLRRQDGAIRFDVPNVRAANVVATGTLRVVADDSWALRPATVQQLEAVADTGGGGRDWQYRFRSALPRATFQIRPAAPADFKISSTLDWQADGPVLSTKIEAQTRRGELRSITLTAAKAEGWQVVLDAPSATQVRELPPEDRRRVWVVDLRAATTGDYRLGVTARLPGAGAGELTLPAFSVRVLDSRNQRIERTIALAGPHWRVANADGFTAVSAEQWHASDDDSRLTVERSTRDESGSTVGVDSENLALAQAPDGRWLVRANYRLRTSGPDELLLRWASPVRLLCVSNRGVRYPVGQEPTRDFSVKLTSDGDDRSLTVIWELAHDRQPPRVVKGPALATARGPLTVQDRSTTVAVPAGWRVMANVRQSESRSPFATSQREPFDELFERQSSRVQFGPHGSEPLKLDWALAERRWPLVLARLLGVATFFGLMCLFLWRPRGPVWPFVVILLGAIIVAVDGRWFGAVLAVAGIVGGTALSLSGRTRSEPAHAEELVVGPSADDE